MVIILYKILEKKLAVVVASDEKGSCTISFPVKEKTRENVGESCWNR